MRFAQNKNHQVVDAQYAPAGQKYYCPLCRELVYLRGGNYCRRHFVHACKRHLDGSYHNEEHTAIQKIIAAWFRRYKYLMVIERSHKHERRRSDLAVDDRSLCIEVQCSPIQTEEIMARTSDYRKLYRKVLWLNSWRAIKQVSRNKFSVPAFILQNLYVQDELYFFSVEKKQLIILSHILRLSPTLILATKTVYSINDSPEFLLKDELPKKDNESKYTIAAELLRWKRKLRYQRKFAVMNYYLCMKGIDAADYFSLDYRLPQIHIGLFNWQLFVIWQYFCCGTREAENCLQMMKQEKTVASVTEATVQGVQLFIQYLHVLAQHEIQQHEQF